MNPLSEPLSDAGRLGTRPRLAIGAFFFLNGVVVSSWAARIPDVMRGLRLDEGRLGLALFLAEAGTVVGLLWMERRLDRYGSHRVIVVAAVAVSLGLLAPGAAGTLTWLMAALLAFGLSGGILNVAMNAQAVTADRRAARPIMSYFHAAYSVGGLVGAGLGALAVAKGVTPLAAFAGIGLATAVLAVFAGRHVVRDAHGPTAADDDGESAPRLDLRMVLLGVCCFACLMAEGVIAGWSAVFLRDVVRVAPQWAPIGFFAFEVAMVIARLTLNGVALRRGPQRLVVASAIVAAVGLTIFILATGLLSGLLGLWIFGLGLACITPQVFRWAGEGAARWTGRAVARVALFGYVGLLSGPPVIGGLAYLVGLRGALTVLVGLMVLVAVVATRIRSVGPAAVPLSP